MNKFIKKAFSIFLILIFSTSFANAKNKGVIANVDSSFTIKNQILSDEIVLRTTEDYNFENKLFIPQSSIVTLKVLNAQRELRWHKGGLILCKFKDYTPDDGSETAIDITDKDIYIVVRKYEAINKKDATLIGIELVLAQGASFFAPGVDIAYYFIKGAIQREKHPHWFKAGVHNAYENSICWFWLKGKPIEIEENDQVKFKSVSEKKADKLMSAINKRNKRFERQAEKRIAKIENKALKKEFKNNKKMVHCQVVEDVIDSITIDHSTIADSIE